MPAGTSSSVTDVPCTCEYLHRAAHDPGNPIVFDARAAEYRFTYRRPGDTELSELMIYHCPWCGGTAPESKRHLLFAVIPTDEERRLAGLLAPVRTVRGAYKRLGRPDRDDAAYAFIGTYEQDGCPPTTSPQRVLVYERLSDVADVVLHAEPGGRVQWRLAGKYIG
jgi:hypothetical protein